MRQVARRRVRSTAVEVEPAAASPSALPPVAEAAPSPAPSPPTASPPADTPAPALPAAAAPAPPPALAAQVPFFRPEIREDEIAAVAEVLRSGWLTSGPNTKLFEEEFAAAVKARHAVALNSCTAALHLATVALDLRPGQGVLIPTMTFAATAEVIRYAGAIPILVDCDPATGHMDLEDAEAKIEELRQGRLLEPRLHPDTELAGLIPVHTAGLMMDIVKLEAFSRRHGLWMVEDAAHSFPSAWRRKAAEDWEWCGQDTSRVTCFSFYANKTITTGEGGMATTEDEELAAKLRSLSLHGLSNDAWGRYGGQGAWDYRILAPGYKYNLTDSAAALGRKQLARAEEMRLARELIAHRYREAFADLEQVELPPDPPDRIHSWHLFQIRLVLEKLSIGRDEFLQALRGRGIGFSVHWRPLHLHPYYQETFGWKPRDLPRASETFRRTISLPIFPAQREDEIAAVIAAVRAICYLNKR
jgi:dTDP-4-amino-4,6-dideoxygalactose transaminase